jgi:hypothetical protein
MRLGGVGARMRLGRAAGPVELRMAAVLIVILMALGGVPQTASAVDLARLPNPIPPLLAPCGSGFLGDVTGDGNVNIIDAQQIARWSVGLSVSATVAARIPSHGDVTGDGNVNIIDAQQIARWAVGLGSSFPIGQALPACQGIRVTTTTTGLSLDPDGYTVFLDGGFASTIGVNGILDLSSATPGNHTVLLQGLAANCSIINGPAGRSVTVVAGQAVSVDYQVDCMGTGQGTLEVRNTTTCSNPPSGPYTVTLDGTTMQSMPVGGTAVFNGVTFGTHQVTLGNVPAACRVDGGTTQAVGVSSGFNTLHFAILNP